MVNSHKLGLYCKVDTSLKHIQLSCLFCHSSKTELSNADSWSRSQESPPLTEFTVYPSPWCINIHLVHVSSLHVWPTAVLLFPVDHNTHNFFCRLQTDTFHTTILIQTDHVSSNVPRDWFETNSWYQKRCSEGDQKNWWVSRSTGKKIFFFSLSSFYFK